MSPDERFHRLIVRSAGRGWPARIHFARVPGYVPEVSRASLMSWPRLNLCLWGRAGYRIRSSVGVQKLTLERGEALYTLPGCVLAPRPQAEYVSLGLVFHPEMTRFLVGRSGPATGHRFLMVHHAPEPLVADGWNLVQALENCRTESPDDPLALALGKALLLLALPSSVSEGPGQGKALLSWRAACHYLEENLHRPMGREQVAAFLQVHPNHLTRLFRRFGGESFNAYVRKLRLQRAREMLRSPGMNVGQVASACGFADANYFIRCYRKAYGRTPGNARDECAS